MSYENQRRLIVIVVIAIIMVVIFTIISLVAIWTPEPEKEKVFEVGVVYEVKLSDNDIVLQHYNDISQILMDSNIDKLCSLVGEDYLKYYNYSIEDIKEYVYNKNIMGKKLELVNSGIYAFNEYSNVFYLDIKAVDEFYSIGIVLREVSPGDYTIAFDKFIDYKENVYTSNVNSIGVIVQKKARFITSVEYRVRITNNYDKTIVLNKNNLSDGMILAGSQGLYKKPIFLGFSNQSVSINAGESREYKVSYSINETTDYLKYNVLVLKDVEYTGTEGTINIEFYM